MRGRLALTVWPGRSELKYMTSWGLTKLTARYQGCPASLSAAPCCEPARDRRRGGVVIGIAAEPAVDQIADAEEIVEAVGLDDLPIVRQRRIDGMRDHIEIGAQMPLALIGA